MYIKFGVNGSRPPKYKTLQVTQPGIDCRVPLLFAVIEIFLKIGSNMPILNEVLKYRAIIGDMRYVAWRVSCYKMHSWGGGTPIVAWRVLSIMLL